MNIIFCVDLPIIVSKEWMCFMDPQMKIWEGKPGRKYEITVLADSDLCAPFKFSHACSLQSNKYPGTIIRLPLRNKPSDISNIQYTTEEIETLLNALKYDAEAILLFLRSIENIEVFRINENGEVSNVCIIKADEIAATTLREQKKKFLEDIAQYDINSASGTFLQLQYKITISYHDIDLNTEMRYTWLVVHHVGSLDKDATEACKHNKECSLPWIGLAVPLTMQCPSRLFCFLPLPDSKEVNPPLPVCVHGTFGLTPDRRHLKWITSDMKNDGGALWNEILLSKILPSCYQFCLNTLKDKCSPDEFYSFWPSISTVHTSNWKIILNPLLSLLLQDEVFWSRFNHTWVKLQSCVYVVPKINGSTFPQAVISALINCGKTIIMLHSHVWEAVEYVGEVSFTIITPSIVRQTLKSNQESYVNMNRAEKLQLLCYCLDDDEKAYNELCGLALLPVRENIFVTFTSNNSQSEAFTCSSELLQANLLSFDMVNLVNLTGEDDGLHKKLVGLAESKCTQLQAMTLQSLGKILKSHKPFQNGYCDREEKSGFFNQRWLASFWKWIKNNSLTPFMSIPLIPVSTHQGATAFKIVPLSLKCESKVIKCAKNKIYDTEMINVADKLRYFITYSEEYEFFNHLNLDDFVNDFSPPSFLEIYHLLLYTIFHLLMKKLMHLENSCFKIQFFWMAGKNQ